MHKTDSDTSVLRAVGELGAVLAIVAGVGFGLFFLVDHMPSGLPVGQTVITTSATPTQGSIQPPENFGRQAADDPNAEAVAYARTLIKERVVTGTPTGRLAGPARTGASASIQRDGSYRVTIWDQQDTFMIDLTWDDVDGWQFKPNRR